ncbi:Transposase family Tnp2 protein [Ceratobasidium sp. AG-Ba]|nr:Transposase family Tnp2 protein [Ceratobasidium sp. AG-Ba]
MEWFNGALAHANMNYRFVWTSIENHVLQIAQLSQIKLIYGLSDALCLEDERYNMATGTRYDAYPGRIFVRPMRTAVLHHSIRRKVAMFVSNKLGLEPQTVIQAIKNRQFVLWGRMQVVKGERGGDLIRGHALSPSNERVSCNASYVKYFTRLSRWNRTLPRELAEDTFGYGRVEQFVVVDANFLQDICAQTDAPVAPLDPLVLAVISPIPSFKKQGNDGLVQYDMPGNRHAPPEIIDATAIECLVGRARAPSPYRTWYIIERSTIVGNINMLDTMADPPWLFQNSRKVANRFIQNFLQQLCLLEQQSIKMLHLPSDGTSAPPSSLPNTPPSSPPLTSMVPGTPPPSPPSGASTPETVLDFDYDLRRALVSRRGPRSCVRMCPGCERYIFHRTVAAHRRWRCGGPAAQTKSLDAADVVIESHAGSLAGTVTLDVTVTCAGVAGRNLFSVLGFTSGWAYCTTLMTSICY